ncbi:MAG: ribosomal protein S18-alanine N-acetyltransferase [Gammaproteobacteria bacterium]|jgi:ribosomal-protein-alanine N-acetyltransferase
MSAVIREPAVNFRPMDEQDLTAVLAIEGAAYEFPWGRIIFRDCLRVGYSCWVMERDGVIDGYSIMSVAVGECHILNLCVDPGSHGRGYGGVLLGFMLDIARKHQADTAFLEVRPSNEAAKRLYRQAGFDEVGLRRNYYPARFGREDAIIMARSL